MVKKITPKDTEKKPDDASSQRILLEEYRALHAHYLDVRNQGVTRINFFITAASVALGGVLAIGSANAIPVIYFKLMLLSALTILVAIGIEIYNFLIQRDLASDRDVRGMARIRNYFVKLDPDLENYFINSIYDVPTYYLVDKSSGTRRVAQIIEGFLLGLDAAILISFMSLPLEIYVAAGICVTVLAYLILEFGAHVRLRQALRFVENDMRFNENVDTKLKTY